MSDQDEKRIRKSSEQKQNKPQGHQRGGPRRGMALSRPAEKPEDFKGTAKRLIIELKPEMPYLFLMTLFTVGVIFIAVYAPDYQRRILNNLQGIVDGSLGTETLGTIESLFVILIVLFAVRFVLDIISHQISIAIAVRVGKKFRNKLRLKMERLPMKFFDSKQTGDTLSVFSNDVEAVTNSIQQSLMQLIQSFLLIIGVLAMMFYISWRLTIIALLVLPLFILTTMLITKRSQKRFAAQQKDLGRTNGFVEETFNGHKVMKLFGKEDETFAEFESINESLAEQMKSAQFLSGMIRPLMEFISNIGYVAVVIVGGILAGATNPLLIGDITVFVNYQRSFVNPILNLANIINLFQSTLAGAERIFKILDEDEEIADEDNAAYNMEDFRGHVVLDDVWFSYSKDTELIKHLNLEVKPGKQIAIVGPTGAGKTTLVNLLMRFYEVDRGTIMIDGVKSTDVPRETLRKLFGMVLQDTWLFAGTIRENVAYGNPDATDEEVINACKQAHVHHYIETLPDGYDTFLKEDAANISQGQKQLLTIARAILFEPKLLILDEATSSVDTRTESYIQNAMDFMMKDRTSFVIAHRLSTIKRASLILVMEHGEIVEKGTHDDLMDKKGAYAKLYNAQFSKQTI